MENVRYFITVDWCNEGRRGVFTRADGAAFPSDSPHTGQEMYEVLGPFWLILNPTSEPLTEEELREYSWFIPLAEYSNEYGIARRSIDVPIREGGSYESS